MGGWRKGGVVDVELLLKNIHLYFISAHDDKSQQGGLSNSPLTELLTSTAYL